LLGGIAIGSRLQKIGAHEYLALATPKAVRDNNPDLSKKIDKLVEPSRTHHVRLYEGAPRGGEPKKEPSKRPMAKSRTPKKKAAKKKTKRKKTKR
jgi:hypothetical protein